MDERDEIRKQVLKRRDEEAQGLDNKGDGIKITSGFVRECLHAEEMGDGILYAAMYQGQYVFNKTSRSWMYWTGHHWKRDIMDYSMDRVENVAGAYLDEAHNIVDKIAKNSLDKREVARLKKIQEKIYRRVRKLRSENGRVNCLKFANTNSECALRIEGEYFDRDPWLLACKNGVVDLRTGRIRPGRPEDYLLKASPYEYLDIDTPAPNWELFLKEIFNDDEELVAYVQRLLGYAITGLTKEHILPIFWGHGRNGKGTLVETISHILGDLAGPIPSEMLLDQGKFRSSTSPTPDIMSLHGLRIAFSSESDEGRRFSPSKVKWLSGGDTLVGRNPHDKYSTRFRPTHTLFMLTNSKPSAPADDYAFWERIHLIPFELSFVTRKTLAEFERPADKDLKDKLESEACGILSWLIRGCLEWQEKGLATPPKVAMATKEYHRDEDVLGDFIEEYCYLDSTVKVEASDIFDVFTEWWEKNVSKKPISQRRFGKMMSKRYDKVKSGTYKYIGIDLLENIIGAPPDSDEGPEPDF